MTPTDPTVRALIEAINAGDRDGFLALLAPGATMSDDGTDRDLNQWIDKEIFTADGNMQVDEEADGGRELTAMFRNSTWGKMHTRWRFVIQDGKISRFETGQA